MPDEPRADLGVLLVHGIGTQKEGGTLVAASSSLIAFAEEWAAAGRGSVVIDSVTLPTGASLARPAPAGPEIIVTITDDTGEAQQWVLRETWWGGIVTPPRFLSMLSWALTLLVRSELQILRPIIRWAGETLDELRGVPAQLPAIADAAFAGIASAASGTSAALVNPSTAEAGTGSVTQPSSQDAARRRLALALAPPPFAETMGATAIEAGYGGIRVNMVPIGLALVICAVATLAVSLILAFAIAVLLVPVVALSMVLIWAAAALPRVGVRARAVQAALAQSVGDAFIWQRDPIMRAAMISAFRRDLLALGNSCDRVAVVAHSQGAAIVHEALRTDRPTPPSLRLLITYGQGIARLDRDAAALDLRAPWSDAFHWHDYCADRDPVSVEPLPPSEQRTSARVRNLRSAIRDHTSYWTNDEDFVGPVLLSLHTLAERKASETDKLARVLLVAQARRRQRVAVLTAGRLGAAAFVLGVVTCFDASLLRWIATGVGWMVTTVTDVLPFVREQRLPTDAIDGALGTVIGAVALTAVAAAWAWLLVSVWKPWDARERAYFRQRVAVPRRSATGSAVMAWLVGPFAAAIALVAARADDLRSGWTPGGVIVALLGLACLTVLAAWRVAMPPTLRARRKLEEAARKERERIEDRVARGMAILESLPQAKCDELVRRFESDPDAQLSVFDRLGMS